MKKTNVSNQLILISIEGRMTTKKKTKMVLRLGLLALRKNGSRMIMKSRPIKNGKKKPIMQMMVGIIPMMKEINFKFIYLMRRSLSRFLMKHGF